MGNSLDKPVEYMEHVPINFGIYEIEYCPIHLHEDIEIMYVLNGTVEMSFSTHSIQVEKNDLHIINSNDLHDIRGLTEGHQMLLMRIDISKYMQLYDYFNIMTFDAKYSDKTSSSCVKNNLMKIYELRNSGVDGKNIITELTDDIISILVENFQVPFRNMDKLMDITNNENSMAPVYIETAHKILDYIYNNYSSQITLDSMTDSMDIHTNDFSSVFTSPMDVSFNKLLDRIRIIESEKKLFGTEDSMEKIASTCGFSSLVDFVEKFTDIFGCTPGERIDNKQHLTISNLDIKGRELTYSP